MARLVKQVDVGAGDRACGPPGGLTGLVQTLDHDEMICLSAKGRPTPPSYLTRYLEIELFYFQIIRRSAIVSPSRVSAPYLGALRGVS